VFSNHFYSLVNSYINIYILYSTYLFSRALVHAMVEILFRCGTEKHAVIVSLGSFAQDLTEGSADEQSEVLIALILMHVL
jgi:hypothetical protein